MKFIISKTNWSPCSVHTTRLSLSYRQVKTDGNKGWEAAKMCIYGPTGKWGFNPSKQVCVRLVTETADSFEYLFTVYLYGKYDKVNLQTITKEVSVACLSDNDHMTEHTKSNVTLQLSSHGIPEWNYRRRLRNITRKGSLFWLELSVFGHPSWRLVISTPNLFLETKTWQSPKGSLFSTRISRSSTLNLSENKCSVKH